jgi:hypothetical protein
MKIRIAIAAIAMLALSSCNKDDNKTEEPVTVVGKWYAEYPENGTFYDENNDVDVPYSKAIQYYEFVDGQTGYWMKFLFCEGSTNPDHQYGSRTGMELAAGAFTYTIDDEHTIHIMLNRFYEDDPYNNVWTLNVSGNKITGIDNGTGYILLPATDTQAEQVERWDNQSHGGSSEDAYEYTDINENPASTPAS